MKERIRCVCGMFLLFSILTGCGNIVETEEGVMEKGQIPYETGRDNLEARVEKLVTEQETEIVLSDGYVHKIRLGIEHYEDRQGEVYLEFDGIKRNIETAEQMGSAYVLYKDSGRVFLLLDIEVEDECYSTMIFEFSHGRLVQIAAMDEGFRIEPDSVTTESVMLIRDNNTSQEFKITSDGELEE